MAHVHGAAEAGKKAAQNMMQGMSSHAAPAAAASFHNLAQGAAKTTSFHNLAKGAAASGAVAAGAAAKKSLLARAIRHPVVLFGLGLAVGYALHKYRKEIIGAANRAAEKSKDFVLQQRENLEDLVAESREAED
jgi:hypothetical protein